MLLETRASCVCCCVAPSREVEPLQLQRSVPTPLTVSRKGPAAPSVALPLGPPLRPALGHQCRNRSGVLQYKPWKSTLAAPRSCSRPLPTSWVLLLIRRHCSGLPCLNNSFVAHVILYCTLSPQIVTAVLCAPGVLTPPFSVPAPHDTGTQG